MKHESCYKKRGSLAIDLISLALAVACIFMIYISVQKSKAERQTSVSFEGLAPLELPFDALATDDIAHAYVYIDLLGGPGHHELDKEEVGVLLSALQEIRVYYVDDEYVYTDYGGSTFWHSPTFRIELADGDTLDIDWATGNLGGVLTLNGTYYRGDGATFAALERFYFDDMWPYFQNND